MKHICHNCFEIIERISCPKCGFVNEELNSELYANARMAVRYGYSYRKIAQKTVIVIYIIVFQRLTRF